MATYNDLNTHQRLFVDHMINHMIYPPIAPKPTEYTPEELIGMKLNRAILDKQRYADRITELDVLIATLTK